jgi:hypothetical protein
VVHPERARNVRDGVPGVDPRNCFLALVRREFLRRPEAHAPRLGALTAFPGAGADQRALEGRARGRPSLCAQQAGFAERSL